MRSAQSRQHVFHGHWHTVPNGYAELGPLSTTPTGGQGLTNQSPGPADTQDVEWAVLRCSPQRLQTHSRNVLSSIQRLQPGKCIPY